MDKVSTAYVIRLLSDFNTNATVVTGQTDSMQEVQEAKITSYEEAIRLGILYSNDYELKRSKKAVYELYKLTGKYDQALIALEEMVAAKDSLNEVDTAKKLQKAEFDKERLTDSLQNERTKLKTEMLHHPVCCLALHTLRSEMPEFSLS